MKKLLFIFGVCIFYSLNVKSQCVANCGIYTVNPITYSLFPTGGTNVVPFFSPNSDDGYTPSVPIGFTFRYYCTNYTTLYICSNGFIVFGNLPSINGADPAQSFPSTTTPDGIVAFNMCDIDAGAGGAVTYTTIGTSPNQQFIVTYSNVPYWYATAPTSTLTSSGQIVLYETSNKIEIHTATVGVQPALSSQGIENQNGTSGVNVPNRTTTIWSASNSAYEFTNVIQPTPPAGVGGNSVVCFGTTGNYSCASMNGASSYSWTVPSSWNGNSTSTNLTATANITGSVFVSATYSCGTSAPTPFLVNVLPSPVINVSSISPNIVCSGNTVAINVNGGLNYTLMPGTITGISPFIVMPMANTTYSVYGDNINGCVSTVAALAQVNVNATPSFVVNSGSICLGQQFTMTPVSSVTYSYSYSSLFNQVTPFATGTYTYLVLGTSTNGCIGSATSTLVVNPTPTILASASKTTICVKETVTLTATGASTINWVTGVNSPSIVVNHTVSNPAEIYNVTGINNFGCAKTASIAIKVNACLGLDEQTNQVEKFRISPNPSSSIFKIQIDQFQNKSFRLINAVGEIIMEDKINKSEFVIDLLDSPAGVYYFIVDNYTQKIIKIE